MNVGEIRKLVAEGESNVLEFKTSTAKLKSAFETTCAFLNGGGGSVLIGVKDAGEIVGQNVTDNTRREIANEVKKIEPAAPINIRYVKLKDNKFLIIIKVLSGNHVPYIYDSRAFQRNESQTDRMTQHCYEQLLIKRGQLNHAWGKAIAQGYELGDLDQEEIYRTVMDGITEKRIPPSIAKESIEKILRQLDLMDNGKLKRAAVVLFGKEIKSGYTQCWLKMARFRGTDKLGEFMDSHQVHCNVFRMLDEADTFLRKHLPIASYFKPNQFKRIDKPALPVIAVREALVNAICHRNYADQSGYISIAIFDDAVEIWSNGTLPGKLRLADLKRKHDSILRNELIAKIFYLRGYIEAWGTGTIRMVDLCKSDKVPAPKFSERTEGLVVTFKLAEAIGGSKNIKKSVLTRRQQEIFHLLEESPLNSAQITAQLKGSLSRRMVQIELAKLEKVGIIRREGESRAITWKVVT